MPEAPTKPTPAGSKKSIDEDLRGRLGVASRVGEASERPTWRGRIIGWIQTFFWVAPLTLLIWIYAEREQRIDVIVSRVPIEVHSEAEDRIVTLSSQEERFLELDLYGPRASIEEVRVRLTGAKPLQIFIPRSVGLGAQDVTQLALDRIRTSGIFAERGIEVKRIRPAIEVKVVEKTTLQAPVRVRPGEEIVAEFQFKPDVVEVQGPADVLGRLPPEQLVVYADVSKFVNPGRYEELVKVRFPHNGGNITYPAQVKAIVIVHKSEPYTLERPVPVKVLMPAVGLELDRYKISTSATLPNVSVTGPPDAIQALKDAKFIPSVIVELTVDDLKEPGDKIKRIGAADYRMPRDVTVSNAARDIVIKLESRGG